MNLLFSNPNPASPADHIQGRLLRLAAIFLFLVSLILTLSPAARAHTWDVPMRWVHWAGFAVWLVGFSLVHRLTTRLLPERDPYLIPLAAVLSGWGLLTIWRMSTSFGIRQTIWLALSLAILWVGFRFSDIPQKLKQYKYLWFISSLVLLGLTFVFGTFPDGDINGPRLWLGCCGVFVQPSEPLKLLLIVYLSAYMADHLHLGFSGPRVLLPSVVLVGAALLLLLAQHDLGTASLFLVLFTVIIYVATEKKRFAAISMGGMLLALGLGYLRFDVVRLRIDTWINPWVDPDGRAYQIVQSLIAFATGNLMGRGPGMGSPTLIPVSLSDFIFAAIGEEFGLLGTAGLILILGLFAIRGLKIALRASDPYHRYLAAGLTCYLVAQAILIAGGNLRLLPLTGVTLPFVSYGGSSLVTSFISLFLLIQISAQTADSPEWVNPKPVLYLGAALLVGLIGIVLMNGWWSIVRSEELTAREGNLRPAISDLYSPRGDLLDRNGAVISHTTGTPGEFERLIDYPPLSPVVGYAKIAHGQTGLESSLSPYLRGIQGQPYLTVWWAGTLYGQSPPGLDVRLTLDIELQKVADSLLDRRRGAAVLLNAQTGEILAMASHPGFDANRLDEAWDTLVSDPNAPLINRASAGQYPLGTALGTFLLAGADSPNRLPPSALPLSSIPGDQPVPCSLPLNDNPDWGDAVASGCPAPIIYFAQQDGNESVKAYLVDLGFYTTPEIPFLTAAAGKVIPSEDPILNLLGLQDLRISPLQAALAAALISADGRIPEPQVMAAYQAPDGEWSTVAHPGTARQVIPSENARQAAFLLAASDLPAWSVVGRAVVDEDEVVSWFLGGTLPEWQGTPLAMVILLEEDNPGLAHDIGMQLLDTVVEQ